MKKLSVLIYILLIFTYSAMAGDRAISKNAKAADPRTALVIGNSDYVSSPLKNPVNDAKAMSEVLTELGFKVHTVYNGDQRAIKHAINEFGQEITDNKGVGLFYYAGHGIQAKGRNFMVPVDAVVESESDIEYEGIDVGRVLGKMATAKNSMNIVILDACRNNPFARSFRSSTQGLATIDAPMGTFIAYATAPGSVAADGDGDNGLFTEALIKTMEMPNIAIEEVFKAVRVRVLSKSEGRQVPWQSSSLIGNFYFRSDDSIPAMSMPQPIIDFTEKKPVISKNKRVLIIPVDAQNQIKCDSIYNLAWKEFQKDFKDISIAASACEINYGRKYDKLPYDTGSISKMWARDKWYNPYKLNIPEMHRYMKENKYDFIISARLVEEHAIRYRYVIFIYDMHEDFLYRKEIRITNSGLSGSADELYQEFKLALQEISDKYNYSLY